MPVTEGKISVTEGVGKNLETTTVTTGAGTVEREVTVLGDPETAAARAKVTGADPSAADYGVVTRNLPSGTQAVSGTVAISSVIPGVGATNLGKMEDTPAADGDVGVLALTVRQDVLGSMVGASGDYQAAATDAQGRVRAFDDISATVLREMLSAILVEMRVQTTILHATLNCRDDVDALRIDAMQQGRIVNEAN